MGRKSREEMHSLEQMFESNAWGDMVWEFYWKEKNKEEGRKKNIP